MLWQSPADVAADLARLLPSAISDRSSSKYSPSRPRVITFMNRREWRSRSDHVGESPVAGQRLEVQADDDPQLLERAADAGDLGSRALDSSLSTSSRR